MRRARPACLVSAYIHSVASPYQGVCTSARCAVRTAGRIMHAEAPGALLRKCATIALCEHACLARTSAATAEHNAPKPMPMQIPTPTPPSHPPTAAQLARKYQRQREPRHGVRAGALKDLQEKAPGCASPTPAPAPAAPRRRAAINSSIRGPHRPRRSAAAETHQAPSPRAGRGAPRRPLAEPRHLQGSERRPLKAAERPLQRAQWLRRRPTGCDGGVCARSMLHSCLCAHCAVRSTQQGAERPVLPQRPSRMHMLPLRRRSPRAKRSTLA